MKRMFNKYSMPPWLRKVRAICAQFIIPFCIFQAVRTILIPTIFDVLLLIIFIGLFIAIQTDYI